MLRKLMFLALTLAVSLALATPVSADTSPAFVFPDKTILLASESSDAAVGTTDPSPSSGSTEGSTWGRIKTLYEGGQDGIQMTPGYCFVLSVPFIAQVPPGDWGNTKNCGQACAVMLGGYFNGGTVAPWVITAENSWLANYTGDSRYRNANCWYTGGGRLGAYRELLRQFHGLQSAAYNGRTIDDVLNEVTRGLPVIVGERISDGWIVPSGGVSHWALVIGWNGNVILHNPGSSGGAYNWISQSVFEQSWAQDGRIYIPVWR